MIDTSSLNSIGVFCGDDVDVGLNIVFVEFVDDVRLPIQKKRKEKILLYLNILRTYYICWS